MGPSGIKNLILWSNGTVSAFDEAGEQIPDFQGRVTEELIEELLQAGGEGSIWREEPSSVSKPFFFEKLYSFVRPLMTHDFPSAPAPREEDDETPSTLSTIESAIETPSAPEWKGDGGEFAGAGASSSWEESSSSDNSSNDSSSSESSSSDSEGSGD